MEEGAAARHDEPLDSKENDGLVVAIREQQAESSFLTPVVFCILATETAERFVFYGFRALLVLYFTRQLHFSESTAIALYSYNNSFTYLSPLLGAALADGSWGRYPTIVRFGSIYVVGLTILATAASFTTGSLQRMGSFLGLALISLGTGGIKPCVSSFGADQVVGDVVRRFFIYFYFCINIGSLIGVAMIPMIREWSGDGSAFFTAAACMGLAMVLFVSQKRAYVMRSNEGANIIATLQKMMQLLWAQQSMIRRGDTRTLVRSESSSDSIHNDGSATDQILNDAQQALRILPIMAMFPIYWCLYDQQGSVWTLQATKMKLPYHIQPEQLNIINPVQILLLIPLFERWIYPFLDRRRFNTSALRRMSWGMVITAAGFFVSGLVESSIQHRQDHGLSPLHVAWQLPQITLLSIGEILLSITGLEFSYDSSPERLKALVTALFLCTTAVGDFLSGALYSTVFTFLPRSMVMHVCALFLLLNHRVFVSIVVRQYEQQQRPATSSSMELSVMTT